MRCVSSSSCDLSRLQLCLPAMTQMVLASTRSDPVPPPRDLWLRVAVVSCLLPHRRVALLSTVCILKSSSPAQPLPYSELPVFQVFTMGGSFFELQTIPHTYLCDSCSGAPIPGEFAPWLICYKRGREGERDWTLLRT